MRRPTLALVAGVALAAGGSSRAAREDDGCRRVYIGTQSAEPDRGIATAVFDPRSGALSASRTAAVVPRPIWLLTDPAGRLLYAVSDPRDAPGTQPRVLAYRIDAASGDLRLAGAARAPGNGPTFLSLDAASRTLFVAHYGSGSVAALPVADDGSPRPATSLQADSGTGPSPRQTAPHAHAAVPDPSGRFVLVPDLGADRVFVYRFDRATRRLTPGAVPFLQLPPGNGPRHLVFARGGRHAYLVSELAGEVRTLRWDPRTGRLSERQVLALDPPSRPGPRSGAEIGLGPDGRMLYASNRGDDTIVGFRIDARTGLLTPAGQAAAGGKNPWSFAIDPTGRWMLVANQQSDSIAALPIDARTGLPGAPRGTTAVAKPVSVTFAGRAPCPAG